MMRYYLMTNLIAVLAGATVLNTSPASAQSQTFRTYTCADGSQFAAAFYKYNPRFAHLQIDGKAIALKKRASLSGTRFTSGGVTLRISKEGVTTLSHAKAARDGLQFDLTVPG